MDLVIFMKKQQEELGRMHQREEHTGSQRSSPKGARIPSSRSVDSIVPRDVAASLERMDLNTGSNGNLNGNSNNGYTFNSGSNNGFNGKQKARRRSNDRGATNLPPPTAAFSEELPQQALPYALHPPSPQFTSPRNLSPQSHSPNQQLPSIPFGSAMTNGYPPYHPQQFYGQQQQQQQQHFTFQGYDQDQGTSFQQNYHVPYAIQTQGMSQDNSGQSSPLSHSELYMSQDSCETLSLQEQLELQDELDPLDSFEENYHTRRRASTFDKHTENQYPPPPRGKISTSISDPEGLARYDREASHLIERRNSASSQKSRSRSRSPMPTPPLPQKARFPSSRRRLSLSANAPLPVIHQQSPASLQAHRRSSLPDLHPYGGTGLRKSGSHSDGFNELTSISSPSLSTVPVIEEAEDEQFQSEGGYYGVQHQHREVYQADFIKEILDFPPPDSDFPSHPSYDHRGLYEGESQLQLGLAPLTPMSMGNLSTSRFSELMYHTEAYSNGL